MTDTIVPLLKPDGMVSEAFPKNLSALFAIDRKWVDTEPQFESEPFLPDETAKSLLAEYGVPSSADDPRDKTMNSLMYFLGVGYQVSLFSCIFGQTFDKHFSS